MNLTYKAKQFFKKIREKIKRLLFYNEPFDYDDEEIKKELYEIEEYQDEETEEYPHNQENYPFNIYEPFSMNVNGEEYTCYKAKFNSLYDLYSYLKSDPKLNRIVFRKLHSEDKGSDFAGIPYDDAVEDLINPPRSDYKEFLRLSKKLDENTLGYVQEYITVKSPGGGVVDVPSYVSGDPLCYRIQRNIYTPKFIRVYISLSYYWGTTKEQVLNRALIISSLVNAFERSGYVVELNTFEMSREEDELININVNIKNNNESFNKASLYKSLCYVEFLRRILFRVLETLDVKNDWQHGYGQTCSEKFIRNALNFEDTDIFFDQPNEMGIYGKDITSDFENVLAHLNLEDVIDVDQAKKEFKKDIMSLKKTIK